MQKKGSEKQETQFVIDSFNQHPEKIKTVIDLGGGVGTHALLLAKKGYDVTLFDQSKKALQIAKQQNPKLKTVQGSFETISLKGEYDAAICMWSTLSYIFSERGRKHFYNWQNKHVRHLIILDEANFYRYGKSFHKIYEGENKTHKLTVIRDWVLTPNHLKKTKFIYKLTDKHSGKTLTIPDAENEQYVTVPALKQYLGTNWKLHGLYGEYSLEATYDKKHSLRILTTFHRKH